MLDLYTMICLYKIYIGNRWLFVIRVKRWFTLLNGPHNFGHFWTPFCCFLGKGSRTSYAEQGIIWGKGAFITGGISIKLYNIFIIIYCSLCVCDAKIFFICSKSIFVELVLGISILRTWRIKLLLYVFFLLMSLELMRKKINIWCCIFATFLF